MQVSLIPSIKPMSNTDKQKESLSLWEMRKIETIEEFYTRKFGGIPANIRNEIGHFNNFFKKHVNYSLLKFRNS